MEERITNLENRYNEIRESQDHMFILQGDALKKLEDIRVCLKGTEYDKNGGNGHGGGLVKRVGKLEDRCDETQKFIAGTKGRNKAVWALIILFGTYIVGAATKIWDKIFN